MVIGLPIKPIFVTLLKIGKEITVWGTIMVNKAKPNKSLLPLKGSLAKAYPAKEVDTNCKMVTPKAKINEFLRLSNNEEQSAKLQNFSGKIPRNP